MAPHGDRKKRKAPDRPGKPDLRPNRKEFKTHCTEEVEKGGGIEQQEQRPAPHAAALDADDGDFPRGGHTLVSRDEREEPRTGAEAGLEKEERRGKKKTNTSVPVGTIVSGVVERVTPEAVVVSVNGFSKGSILNEHLADYHDAKGQNLILSAKHSLINTRNDIPSELSQIQAGVIVHGYICNIIDGGCFVRFLGHLTGFSPKDKAVDRPIEKLSDAFFVGQSVRSHVLNVNEESSRVKLSLQHSKCSSADCSFIQGYFLLDQKIAALKYSHDCAKSFGVGSLVKGEAGGVEEYGFILNFKDYPDVIGLLEHHQLGGTIVKVGSSVMGIVVDFSDGVVNLSLKPELVDSVTKDGKRKKRHRDAVLDLELDEVVNAVVEIVKENHMVCNLLCSSDQFILILLLLARRGEMERKGEAEKEWGHGSGGVSTIMGRGPPALVPSPEGEGKTVSRRPRGGWFPVDHRHVGCTEGCKWFPGGMSIHIALPSKSIDLRR
ncbi:rRNA biogenesis protein RRP5-like isoform X2 [Hordeum vulgare subsp. vulgare]|uniref:rRNA biogenesis protein RRP5-like isoform X2 n=1 Tax=Hordeum vulgare subsp. vulgare TaxID=112509 RepID=UPI001D1A56AA|nr:rRNA biogenesis protein RRP5-like isoform X2 [Hordeum vulgare subsp. vulgare]